MRTSPTAAVADHSTPPVVPQPRQAELIYRGLTLVVMLALLVTLWAF